MTIKIGSIGITKKRKKFLFDKMKGDVRTYPETLLERPRIKSGIDIDRTKYEVDNT